MAASWLSRIRFSILNLVLLTSLIALSLSQFNMSNKLRSVQQELTTARKELAYLDVTSTKNVYAVALPTFEPMQWRWRIQLPDDGNYCVRYAFDQIPIKDYPKATGADAYIFRDKTGPFDVDESVESRRDLPVVE